MDFFQAQASAQRRTKWLVVLFVLAVGATIVATYLATVFIIGQWPGETTRHRQPRPADGQSNFAAVFSHPLWNPALFAKIAGGTLLLVGGAAFFKTAQLRRGGPAVAEMVGGRRVDPQSTELKEKRLLNIVEEMSIASGIPVPAVYLLDDEAGLNAFAAGLTTSDAVVAVTRGSLDKLNRDELQGVVAHEFSHILNGDMRLNIRLVAALFGIFFLTIIGRGLLRSLRFMRGGKKNDGRGALVVLAIGIVLLIIGYIGYFFGRLIQAAVSRQREFLADASAVQFTRNPGGIAGALKKIGGFALGSRVGSAKAAAIGHFFFAESVTSNLAGLLATHPPLDVRIRAIDPQFDGQYFEPREVVDVANESFVSASLVSPLKARPRAEATPAAIVASVGTLTPDQVANAQVLLNEIPLHLQQAAHSPADAPVLIYCLLLHNDPAVRERQRALLPAGTADKLRAFDDAFSVVRPEHKLPLCLLALPVLHSLEPAVLGEFFAVIKGLVEADGSVSTFEFALQKILHRHVVLGRSPGLKPGAQIYSFHAVRSELAIVLSAVSRAATNDPVAAQRAFAEGARLLKAVEGPFELLAPGACASAQLDAALDRLASAAGPIKQRLLFACAQSVSADGVLHLAEAELVRAVAATLDCPMPPLGGGRLPA